MSNSPLTNLYPGQIALGPASCEISYFGALDPKLRGQMRQITSLEVNPNRRQQGAATALMQEICRVADEEGLSLLVKPEAYRVKGEKSGLQGDVLAAWYRSAFGFFTLQADPLLLVRLPHGREPVKPQGIDRAFA